MRETKEIARGKEKEKWKSKANFYAISRITSNKVLALKHVIPQNERERRRNLVRTMWGTGGKMVVPS